MVLIGAVLLAVLAIGALARAHRSLVPLHAEPLEVADDRLLAAGHVPGRIGVVDPQQQPVAERAVRDGAERVPDVERAGRAGREANAFHDATLVSSSIV